MNGAVSRQTQGAGTYDITLPGVECRNGGPSTDYIIVFNFSNVVTSVDQVTTSCGSINSSAVDGTDGHNFIVHVNGAGCNAQNVTITLTGIHDDMGSTLASAAATVGLLIGDTTGDGSVNSADIGQTKSQSGQAVTGSNFRTDVNQDGTVNSADITLVKSRSGTGL